MAKIYLVTNRQQSHRPLISVLADAVEAGIDAVILREKDLPPEELGKLASMVRPVCAGSETKFYVSSSVEAALACAADGVHLGYGSPPLKTVRMLLPDKTIGVSVHSLAEAVQAETEGADYVLAGNVFATGSKPGQPGQGIDFIKILSLTVSIPVIAIGGINHLNAGRVIRAGAAGIAVMSAVMESTDMAVTVRRLREAVEQEGAL